MKKTVTLSIGNTDNKLTQQMWANFVEQVGSLIRAWGGVIHFFGGPANYEPYQNVAWIFEIEERNIGTVKERVRVIASIHRQDSVAWLEGITQFI